MVRWQRADTFAGRHRRIRTTALPVLEDGVSHMHAFKEAEHTPQALTAPWKGHKPVASPLANTARASFRELHDLQANVSKPMNTVPRNAVPARPDMSSRVASAAPEPPPIAKEAGRTVVVIHLGVRKTDISAKQEPAANSAMRNAAGDPRPSTRFRDKAVGNRRDCAHHHRRPVTRLSRRKAVCLPNIFYGVAWPGLTAAPPAPKIAHGFAKPPVGRSGSVSDTGAVLASGRSHGLVQKDFKMEPAPNGTGGRVIGNLGAVAAVASLLLYIANSDGLHNHARLIYSSLIKVAEKLGLGV